MKLLNSSTASALHHVVFAFYSGNAPRAGSTHEMVSGVCLGESWHTVLFQEAVIIFFFQVLIMSRGDSR